MKRKPTGIIAVCQCGETVGATDLRRNDQDDTARLLGAWLMDGCSLHPQFGSTWATIITKCKCNNDAERIKTLIEKGKESYASLGGIGNEHARVLRALMAELENEDIR